MLVASSWLRYHQSLSLWLHLDLKPAIKRATCGSRREATERSKTLKQRVCRLPPEKIGGGKHHRNHLRKGLPSPSGVSIKTIIKISTISISIFVIHFNPS
jgi:hypothetical protein